MRLKKTQSFWSLTRQANLRENTKLCPRELLPFQIWMQKTMVAADGVFAELIPCRTAYVAYFSLNNIVQKYFLRRIKKKGNTYKEELHNCTMHIPSPDRFLTMHFRNRQSQKEATRLVSVNTISKSVFKHLPAPQGLMGAYGISYLSIFQSTCDSPLFEMKETLNGGGHFMESTVLYMQYMHI